MHQQKITRATGSMQVLTRARKESKHAKKKKGKKRKKKVARRLAHEVSCSHLREVSSKATARDGARARAQRSKAKKSRKTTGKKKKKKRAQKTMECDLPWCTWPLPAPRVALKRTDPCLLLFLHRSKKYLTF